MPSQLNHMISLFWGRIGIVWYTLLSTLSSPLFPALLVNFCCRCSSCPYHCLTDWGGEPLSAQHTSLSSQRVKWSDCRPLSIWPTEASMIRFFMMRHQWGIPSNILRTLGSQRASTEQGATRIKCLTWPVTCSTGNLDRTRGTKTEGRNT